MTEGGVRILRLPSVAQNDSGRGDQNDSGGGVQDDRWGMRKAHRRSGGLWMQLSENSRERLRNLFLFRKREILVQISRWKPQEYFVYFKASIRDS